MRLSEHAALTAPVFAVAYFKTGSYPFLLGLFLGSILIDVDHLFEFWHDNGFSLKITRFFSFCNSGVNTRFFIVLHSYELVLLLALAYLYNNSLLCLGGAVGVTFHLFLDYLNILWRYQYRWHSFLIFSLVFRWLHGFKREDLDRAIRQRI